MVDNKENDKFDLEVKGLNVKALEKRLNNTLPLETEPAAYDNETILTSNHGGQTLSSLTQLKTIVYKLNSYVTIKRNRQILRESFFKGFKFKIYISPSN